MAQHYNKEKAMRKSPFFQFIISCCQSAEDAAKNKPVSINVFFGTVLKALAIGQEAFKDVLAEGDVAQATEELQQVNQMVSAYTTDFVTAHDNLFSYTTAHSGGFLDNYLYAKIITQFEMDKPAGYVLTVADVCQKILAEPTKAIAYALNIGEQPTQTDTTGDTPMDSESIIAGILSGSKAMPKSAGQPAVPTVPAPPPATGAKPTGMIADIVKRTDAIREILSQSVYGQDHAISAFASGYFQAELTAATQKHRDKPKATFLFAGPPGTGKTFLSEQVAQALKLPFRRFDMSEYSDKEANLEFAGSDKVYKNGAEGNVTGFVAKNPKCILLFDEVEKAHLNIIHLFLQILDAGRLRDNYTDEEVSFTDAIIIFTTNAGRQMYEDDSINLLTASRKSILQALSSDVNPITGAALFPPAICSRFAFGNVIMFNHMSASHLMQIADGEMHKQAKAIVSKSNVKIHIDERLPYAVIFSEGGKADARTIKGKSISFVYQELYELFRLVNSENNNYSVENLRSIDFELLLPEEQRVLALFERQEAPNVLVFADKDVGEKCQSLIRSANVLVADNQDDALAILEKNDIAILICDLKCKTKGAIANALSVEDTDSAGRDFFYYINNRTRVPLYILAHDEKEISREEWFSLSKSGATGLLVMQGGAVSLDKAVLKETTKVFQHKNLFELGRANKVITYKTLQQISDDGTAAKIVLFDFKLKTAVDAQDSHGVLDAVSKPNVHFSDVIGARDAKDELNYFIEYLKNPGKFLRQGVKPPKGILLYGPPGTGKTLLAKAMAGESDVTFIRAEGNQFLKRYVGEGPQAVHDLFKAARKYAPSILFIDEIDAIGKNRGSGGHDTSDVLTSFLTEMDGFNVDTERPVFVLAATNFDVEQGTSRSLDPALLRRFDRRIYVELPNKEERIQFINYKISKIARHSLTAEQIENLAIRSTGSSLADLDSVFEMAIRDAIKAGETTLNDTILEEAFERFTSGDVKKWAGDGLLRTARHEAGHALVCWYGGEKPSYLTIVARASHGGYMQHDSQEDKGSYTKKELLGRVRTSLAGRCAELVYYGDEDGVSTGASGDLRQATYTITNMICRYGMDEKIGMSSIDLEEIKHSPYYTTVISRVNEILQEQLEFTKRIIEANKQAIDNLVVALLEQNSLKQKEIDEILSKSGIVRI